MSSDIEKVELSIEEAKKMVDRRDIALRLADNRDFKKLVIEGYFKDEAARLTGLLGERGDNLPFTKEMIVSDLEAIASFQRFMRLIVMQGDIMEKEIEVNSEALEHMRAEETQ